MVEPSIVPLSTSTFVMVWLLQSIAPPNWLIVILAIVPPSTLSPFIWLSANVNVPAETFTSPVNAPTNSVDVIDVAPVTIPASIIIAPSSTICCPVNGVIFTWPEVDDIVLPSIFIWSTCNDVSIPTDVIAVCAGWVTVRAVPDALPVKLPVNTPAIAPVPVIVGEVNVLFVNVSVVFFPTNISVASGMVIVLSAVGSVTAIVVSNSFGVEPSNIIGVDPCIVNPVNVPVDGVEPPIIVLSTLPPLIVRSWSILEFANVPVILDAAKLIANWLDSITNPPSVFKSTLNVWSIDSPLVAPVLDNPWPAIIVWTYEPVVWVPMVIRLSNVLEPVPPFNIGNIPVTLLVKSIEPDNISFETDVQEISVPSLVNIVFAPPFNNSAVAFKEFPYIILPRVKSESSSNETLLSLIETVPLDSTKLSLENVIVPPNEIAVELEPSPTVIVLFDNLVLSILPASISFVTVLYSKFPRLSTCRTVLFTPLFNFDKVLVLLAYKISPVVSDVIPVPPSETANVPVILDAAKLIANRLDSITNPPSVFKSTSSVFPFLDNPSPAVIWPAPENCVNVKSVPTVVPEVTVNPLFPFVSPPSTNVNAFFTSAPEAKSSERVQESDFTI